MKNRLKQVLDKMEEKKLECLLISSPSNIFYLTGFDSDESYIVIKDKKAYLLTDFRYYDHAVEKVEDFEVLNYNERGFIPTIAAIIDGASIVGFEEEHLRVKAYKHLEIEFSGLRWQASSGLVEEIRRIKDKTELKKITKACEITDYVFSEILSRIQPGMTEKEIAARIDYLLVASGADEPAFSTRVIGGGRTAFPHVKPSAYPLNEGDLILLDFGASWGGYKADMTRTLVLGQANPRQRELYETVHHAYLQSLASLKPGLLGKEVDKAARDIIDEAGFRKEFGHALGHGLGLEIHEAPRLSILSEEILEANMVVTLEPGIYLPGTGGLRIEDTFMISHKGAMAMTKSDRELIEIPV